MNFFEHQDRARRNTTALVFLFSLAVAGIVVALYAASRIVVRYAMVDSTGPYRFAWWDPKAFAIVAIGGILFIGIASLAKAGTLARGGGAVAEMLGGRPVAPDTTDYAERRFLNVVEEMALASGVPVPRTYVLDREDGINAFAAGHTPNDAAVAVTRGTLNHLNRSELQGVVGHEFSHILNGDMRLNVRLIAILFGILALGIVGHILIRVGGSSGRGSKRGGAAAVPIAGLLLILIGYIGTFVGRMIQAAVSRQREYLADSAAVQFTREPMGLAGALKKIGGLASGSIIRSPKAEQASHLFFSPGVKIGLFQAALATHPPLADRIRRLDPAFDGVFAEPGVEPAGGEEPHAALAGFAGGAGAGAGGVDPGDITSRVGTLPERAAEIGAALRALVPADVLETIQTPSGAAEVLTALFLDAREGERAKQLEILGAETTAEEARRTAVAAERLRSLDPRARLPLADLAAPALARLDPAARAALLARIERLVEADATVTLFEFTLHRMIAMRFARLEDPVDRIRHRSIGPLLRDIATLVGTIAREGAGGDAGKARAAFERGAERLALGRGTTLPFRAEAATDFQALAVSLDRLAESSFSIRERVVDACAHAALADRVVSPEETELLRVVSSSLDSPLPPFLSAAHLC